MNSKISIKFMFSLFAIILLLQITGCGVKGQLYLPDKEETAEQAQQDNQHDND